MDPLFQQAKQMYPNASDEEINQSLVQIRQNLPPNTPDEEVVAAAQKIQGMQQDGSWQKAMVKENVKQKYGLGEYSPEKRQALVDANASAASPIAAGFAGFGAGLRGGDVAAGFKSAMDASQSKTKNELDAFDKARDQKMQDFSHEQNLTKAEREESTIAESKDPTSARSKAAQDMLIQDYGMSPEVAAKMTIEQVEARLPGLKQKLDREMREREFSERQKDRNLQREMMQEQKDITRQDKMEKEAKPSEKQVKEFTDFDNALDSIKSIRAQKGQQDTGPMSAVQSNVAQFFGMDDSEKSAFKSEVQDQLAQYIKSISGGAVSDQERVSLMQNIPKMSDNDETFNKKLDALEARLERNRQNSVTNASKMGKNVKEFNRAEAPKEETKVINSKTYRKVQGGWEEI